MTNPHDGAGQPSTPTCGLTRTTTGLRVARPPHFVLLSRDPNIMYLDVLPKRGVHEAGDLDRLRAILDQHTTRV